MADRTDKDISALMKERTQITAALRRGVREALERHVRAGVPAVEWRDGKCVWLSPDEIRKQLAGTDEQPRTS